MERPPRGSSLFPYTTLFRSSQAGPLGRAHADLELRLVVLGQEALWHHLDEHADREQSGAAGEHDHPARSEEHTSELQSQFHIVCRLLLEKKTNSLSMTSLAP